MKTILLSLALLFFSLVSAAQQYVISPAREVIMTTATASIQVTDLLGNKLINKSVTSETTNLDVSDLSNGYYLIQCKYGNETAGMKKLCITK